MNTQKTPAVIDTPWFSMRKQPAEFTLFCFPFSGGTAAAFKPWQVHNSDLLEVVPVKLPGRETRYKEPAFFDLVDMASAFVDALAPYTDRRYALYGHSMGGLIIFEVVRQIRQRGLPMPEHLFPGAYRSPERPSTKRNIHHLDNEAFLEELRTYEGTPESFFDNPELIDFLLPMLKADFSIHETWVYKNQPPLDIPITGFYGKEDPISPATEMQPWQAHTSKSFELVQIPGSHFFLNDGRPLVLRKIINALKGSDSNCIN